MSDRIVGGIIEVKVDGQIHRAKGDFTYNPGVAKREAVIGSDGVHGWKETPQVPFIEGEFTDVGAEGPDMIALRKVKSATVFLQLGNGKAFVLRDAVYAGDGTSHTEEGNMDVRFEGMSGEEV